LLLRQDENHEKEETAMTLYCGIDLHANNSVVAIIDEQDRIRFEKRLPNVLEAILSALSAFASELAG